MKRFFLTLGFSSCGLIPAFACSKPAPPAPITIPTVVVVPEASVPSCSSAYDHQAAMGCPPDEDGARTWIEVTCPHLSDESVTCIEEAATCAASRGCVPE